MNKKMNKTVKLIAIGATIGALSIPVLGTGTLEKVEAYLNKTLTFTLDGKEVLEDVPALTYNNTTYISVAELTKVLDHEINYDAATRTISLKASDPSATEIPAQPLTPSTPTDGSRETTEPILPDVMMLEKTTIKEINKESMQVTVLPVGLEDTYTNYVVLNVGEDTFIRHEFNKRMYSFDDLQVGMEISAEHSPIMTMSLPPQTPAIGIIILQEQIEE